MEGQSLPCSCGHTILDGASLPGKEFMGFKNAVFQGPTNVLQEDARSTCILKVLQINSFAPSAEYFDLGSKNRKYQPDPRTESSPCRVRRVFCGGIISEVRLAQTRKMEI